MDRDLNRLERCFPCTQNALPVPIFVLLGQSLEHWRYLRKFFPISDHKGAVVRTDQSDRQN